MIALNEALESAAEIPFFLPQDSNPLAGLTGHSFTLGEVKVRLPGAGSFVDVAVNKIREIGFGWYAARLTSSQTTTAGTAIISVEVSGAQPYRGSEVIGVLGGDVSVGEAGFIYFYLPQSADPIYGAPVTSYVFDDDDVYVALPDDTFEAVAGATIVEFGNGFYGAPLSSSNTATRGKALVYATATGAQPFSSWITILDAQVVVAPTPTPTPPLIALPVTVDVVLVDHAQTAVERLCQFAKDRT